MSVLATLARVAEIQRVLSPPPPAPPAPAAGQRADFQSMMGSALAAANPLGQVVPIQGAGGVGAQMVAIAQREIGVTEQPPGSNDSPRIAEYRSATAGAGVGPWCAYFTSWVAGQAGVPLGEAGQGFGLVDAVYAWAQRTGRAIPNGPGVNPQPGDLIVWDEHIGIVESVAADGTVHTIEGNSSDQVIRRTHGAGSALGYVRIG